MDPQVGTALRELAALERPPGSDGEHRAAGRLAELLAARGGRVRVERERVHGTYWVPIGLASATAALGAAIGGRGGAAMAGLCAASIADDLEIGRRPLRRLLGQRTACNVLAEYGPRSPTHTLVVHAHHDAARTGLVFHPAGAKLASRVAGATMDRVGATPAPLWGAVAGPALAAAGSLLERPRLRLAGALLGAGHAAAMLDIARRPAVPGANDNLSGVCVLLSLADSLRERGTERLRVLLLSTGSEESFLEAMKRFGERHFSGLDPARTTFLALESVGSPTLMLLGGEGLLRLHRYPESQIRALTELAERAGIPLRRPFRYRLATDGQVPLRAGFPTAVISSMDWYHAPSNYHWPTDRPDNLWVQSVDRATALSEALLRLLDRPGRG